MEITMQQWLCFAIPVAALGICWVLRPMCRHEDKEPQPSLESLLDAEEVTTEGVSSEEVERSVSFETDSGSDPIPAWQWLSDNRPTSEDILFSSKWLKALAATKVLPTRNSR
jgi:hypothetical protein